jgi:hypothetical protein
MIATNLSHKSALALLGLACALGAWAAPNKAANPAPNAAAQSNAPASAPAPAAAASHAAPAVPPVTPAQSRLAQRDAKARGSLMAACQAKAAQQQLHDVERRQFIAGCMHGQ